MPTKLPLMRLHLLAAPLLIATLAGRLPAAPLPAGDAAAAGFSPERLERVHRLVQGYVDDGKYAGAITLIARDGRIVDARAYGWRDTAKKLPMERDTLFYIFSLTKMTIAVTTLTLWEEGRFNLDDPVATYLPEFKSMKVITGGTAENPELVDARPITIRHLLTHTAGFAYDWNAAPLLKPSYEKADLFGIATMPEFAQALAKIPLHHQPGDAFLYGASYDVLGYLIEKLTGQPLETAMRERVFAPLGMPDTSFVVPPEKRSRLAKVHRHAADGHLEPTAPGTIVLAATGERTVFPSGSGGLVSTIDDFARFAQMLLNRGELGGVRILSPKTVAFMTTDHLTQIKTPTLFMGPAGTYGLGVGVWGAGGGSDSPGSAGRFGWTGAATTYCNIDPQEGTVAMVFAQHFPYDEHGLFPRFSTAFYQSILKTRAP
ncbi:CubicO group peptidase, beta-lactamase class C family [Opitutus sp. GAS368]|nr:CubicO group peptidase, beta-lactamase class C family [Opitutus sp. GAS368]